MAVKYEEEMYQPIKAYYEQRGYTVKSEVMHCDLVAMKPDTGETIIVEMKKTFNLALLLQGVERLRINDSVVLAVERNRKKSGSHNQRFGDLTELCRMLGIGLMTVAFYKTRKPDIEMLCEPGDLPLRKSRRKRREKLLTEFNERSGDYNIGGVTKRKLMTAYREKALRCAWVLQHNGPSSPRQAAALIGSKQAGTILRDNYYDWFEKLGRGVYQLKPAGAAALVEHADVIAKWASTMNVQEIR